LFLFRLLGLRDGVKLGFWRHLIGQGEKWQLLKANTNYTPSLGSLGISNYMGVEDITSRGKYIRIGDMILIQTFKAEHFLSIFEKEARLVYRERTSLAAELWQIELFGTVPLPSWCLNRPYLSGKYLVTPCSLRAPAPEVEARVFPRSAQSSLYLVENHVLPSSLHTLPVSTQQYILMREILLVLAGVEGSYIRVAAAVNTAFPSSEPMDTSNNNPNKYDSRKMLTPMLSTANHPTIILPQIKEIKLVIDLDNADRSTATKISQLLPVCECIIRIRAFLKQQSRYEYGLTSHALCTSVLEILKDFHILIAQLEYLLNTSRLTLQKLVYLLHPSAHLLSILDGLCSHVSESIGGELLNKLHDLYLNQGDVKAKELIQQVLEKTSRPFLRMLSVWIFHGQLHDPYQEFMIHEDDQLRKEALVEDFNASYWDHKYTLSTGHTLNWLTSTYHHRILICGKYLNVVRDCVGESVLFMLGKTDQQQHPSSDQKMLTMTEHVPIDNVATAATAGHLGKIALPIEKDLILDLTSHYSSNNILSAIDDSYTISSQTLLSILMDKYGLYAHIQSLHKYFLLKHGDFFIQFMDIAELELKKEVKDIMLNKVRHLLYMAIQSSTLANEAHKEELTCALASHNLIQHLHLIQMAGESGVAEMYSAQGLKGIEAFTLDYVVAFPLSIVLSRRVITKYQLLSRLLYFSKHVERRLLAAWMAQQSSRDCPSVRGVMGCAYALRHRMLHFMQVRSFLHFCIVCSSHA
jgi:hypothetical protein